MIKTAAEIAMGGYVERRIPVAFTLSFYIVPYNRQFNAKR